MGIPLRKFSNALKNATRAVHLLFFPFVCLMKVRVRINVFPFKVCFTPTNCFSFGPCDVLESQPPLLVFFDTVLDLSVLRGAKAQKKLSPCLSCDYSHLSSQSARRKKTSLLQNVPISSDGKR